MLFVVEPLALVIGSVSVAVAASALGLVVKPFSFVNIAVSMIKFTLAVSFILTPLALVAGTIGPDLNAVAVTHLV